MHELKHGRLVKVARKKHQNAFGVIPNGNVKFSSVSADLYRGRVPM